MLIYLSYSSMLESLAEEQIQLSTEMMADVLEEARAVSVRIKAELRKFMYPSEVPRENG